MMTTFLPLRRGGLNLKVVSPLIWAKSCSISKLVYLTRIDELVAQDGHAHRIHGVAREAGPERRVALALKLPQLQERGLPAGRGRDVHRVRAACEAVAKEKSDSSEE